MDSGPGKEASVRCFHCDKEMKIRRDVDGRMIVMESNGLFFKSSGNYGSTIFDPINCEIYLEIVMCDDCVSEKTHLVDLVKVTSHRTDHAVKIFNAEKDF